MAQSIVMGVANAWDFAFGVNPGIPNLDLASSNSGTGVQTYIVNIGQTYTVDGIQIPPLVINGVLGVGSGGSYEIVVVTAVSVPNAAALNTCTFTATFANAHGVGEPVVSGSFGVQEAAANRLYAGGGCVALTPAWFKNFTNRAAGLAALVTYKSLGANVAILDYSGTTGALSYSAAANSVYASTTKVLY